MEKRVTFEIKSEFKNLHINGINKDNCDDIKRSLSVAMKKAHAPEKLHLHFEGKMNETMIQMTEDYKESITSLGIDIRENEDLLMQPNFIFKSLKGLSLSGDRTDDTNMVRVCETMLAKHASNLKKLRINHLKKNLRVPNLPLLDSLTLLYVNEEAGWNILEHCRPTITRLELRSTYMNSRPLDSNSAAYEIPNIEHLIVKNSSAFNFAQFNAQNLVSLKLWIDFNNLIPENLEWPQFPKLRELYIDNSKYLPILMNSRDSLELLHMLSIHSSTDIDYTRLVMPKLTDLHLFGVDNAITSKICSSNHRSLEFVCFCKNDVPNLDDGVKMERLRNVVLRSNNNTFTAQDRERITEMYNAEFVIWSTENNKEITDQMRFRNKSKKFAMDVYSIFF
jgi:hypothetical protein